jgi:hypothetical protein
VTSATLLPVTGWKQLLSTAPRMARELIGLPFLLAVLGGSRRDHRGNDSPSWACSLPAIAVTS